jgi:putative transcriptional regulator
MSNRVKEFRRKLNLSQAELAERALTSQQQIQRLEAAVQVPRIDLATRLSKVFRVPVETLFPQSEEPYAGLPVDPDPAVHFLKVRLLSGVEQVFPISSMDRDTLRGYLTMGDHGEPHPSGRFFCFNSQQCAVAINIESVAYAHFLFEPAIMVAPEPPVSAKDVSFDIQVYLNRCPEPIKITVNPDRADQNEVMEGEAEGFSCEDCQVQRFLEYLDAGYTPFVDIEDSDGEEVVFQVKHIDLVMVPLVVCNPSLYEDFARMMEAEDEMDEEDVE